MPCLKTKHMTHFLQSSLLLLSFCLSFCNNTTQILCHFILHIVQYQLIFWLTSDIHLNSSNPSIN